MMAEKDNKAELIDAGATTAKPADKAPVKEAPKAPAAPAAPVAHAGLTEDKNEPHIHLAILLVIVIVIGVVIAFVKF
jgi:hypothetical protein